jgi:hypothetical protein
MTSKERTAIVAELHGALVVHDEAAKGALRTASRHLRRAVAIERELQRLEKPRRRITEAVFA